MFKGIQSRLVFSYIAVIGIALFIAVVALFLVAKPLQSRAEQLKLASTLSQIGNAINLATEKKGTPHLTLAQLSRRIGQNLPENLQDQVLIVGSHGQIIFDSQHQWEGQYFDLNSARARTILPVFRASKLFMGETTAPDGNSILFAAQPLGGEIPPRVYLALASPSPTNAVSLLSDLWIGFAIAGVVAFLISILLGWVIVKSLADPLKDIAMAAESVAKGDYSQQVPQTGPTEVKQVAIAFNSMTKQVQSGQQAMKDFVSNVSHDLKTPLTSIQGFSQALIDGTAHDEQSRRQAATIIHAEATRMRRMVDDLLDLARIDAGQISMRKQNIDLTLLLAVVLDSLVPQLEKKNITLTRQNLSLPVLLGDGDRLKQVFLNLMDNAIKYTPENGRIMILATCDEVPSNASTLIRQTNAKPEKTKFVKISIIDSGAGIPQEEIDRIFERFYRVDKSRVQEKGVGLGLAIAYHIVKAHDGYLEAKSIEGTGSTFTVWLPITS